MNKAIAWLAVLATAIPATVTAHPNAPSSFLETAKPYAKYEFLIGDWRGQVGGTNLREEFRWGPNKSYIFFSTYMAAYGKPEQLHFEGMMVWNAKTDVLDYVVAVEPGSGVQEKGIIRAEPGGTIVREVELTDARGKTGHFRQTFQLNGADAVTTSVMRQTAKGWEPTFPGSDRITLTRGTN